jgi:Putative Actinobacterial Holin-X, holin superfamily III
MSTETDRVTSDPPLELPAAPSVGDLVQAASAQLSTLLRAEIELAKAEMSATVKRAAVGAGLLGAAAAVLLVALPFFLIFIAELLVDPVGLPRWSAYLIVWGAFLIIAGILAWIGLRTVKRMRKPERTIETVKETARWARHPTEAGSDT